MQTVSQAWKDNQTETLASESFVEVTLTLTDPEAYENSSATDNGHITISNTSQIVSEVDKDIVPYATLERNLWVLDGSRKIIPAKNFGDCGYISTAFSETSGVYSTIPIVSLEFPEVQYNMIQGVTIEWGVAYDEYATDFTVTAYNGDTVVNTKSVTGNKDMMSVVYMDIVNYDRIDITITKWCLPYRRARIANVLPGVKMKYSKTDLFSFSHKQSVDPISAELPKSEVSFSVENVGDLYNFQNTDGLAKYLIERQEIKVKYGYKLNNKVEWIEGGTFYMSEWDAQQNGMTADFSARDLLEFMTGTYYYGLYNSAGVSLYDLASAVLQDADLPLNNDGSAKWTIDDSLKDIYTVAPLPIDTHANCLQMIANAGGCVIYQDRKGTFHIKPVSYELSDYSISKFNSYSKPELSLSKPLKQVDVPSYSYSVSSQSAELYKGVISVNGTTDVIVTYSSAASNVTATVTGGTLNSATYYTNVCVLNITATGNVTITVNGRSLETSSINTTSTFAVEGEVITVDNPLITSQERALVIGQWVGNYMKNRITKSSSWRADPRLDALDVVSSENDYGVDKVLMTQVDYTYSGAFRGSGEGRVI